MTSVSTSIVESPLDVAAAVAEVASDECGGIGVFVGTVRRSPAGDGTAPVEALEYEVHPSLAEERLRQVAERAAERWDIHAVVVRHRSGRCATGEPTVVIACAAPHRADALDACRWIIDEIKRDVPIWKKEIYADGSSWVGVGS
ncbi:MAG TPA: molybdenum cofactor biosynthesis protein MoaE [Actinomycetota bacterium]|nr:molybdenum cofactor biosynthesis protein MoaE [Actinomycetota bacterium]